MFGDLRELASHRLALAGRTTEAVGRAHPMGEPCYFSHAVNEEAFMGYSSVIEKVSILILTSQIGIKYLPTNVPA